MIMPVTTDSDRSPCQILCVLVLGAPLKFRTRARAVVISMVIIKAVTGAQPATAAHVEFDSELMVCSVWCLEA
jgi:hypothetical protein